MEVYTVNLEEGMPYVDEALEHLEKSLRRAKNGGCKVVKFIHGYGSSGKGERSAGRCGWSWSESGSGGSWPWWCRGSASPSLIRTPSG